MRWVGAGDQQGRTEWRVGGPGLRPEVRTRSTKDFLVARDLREVLRKMGREWGAPCAAPPKLRILESPPMPMPNGCQ